ncbi:unnamed protein product (macronuclear) [Paramecium tetraurelia]|uniref:Transmembrane protein n=1 Tax=Paramecium tetraurelia TaxID=5888 RepID=A0DB30_PARTE|nr:uncharacterized protein GSPATT00015141001 [Paramecium tetraurelia]CAK80247.1 unnamed protein product [Paramecium tetraurelia]|eukprot:XP_001447644.1 hypothetical protein (macronuclear) [Paramecium tetraurelia strain d4-2]
MISKLIIWFKNLRMSNQIIILNFFIILFAVFATIATAYVQQAIFFTYIQEFESALSLKQEKAIVNNISRKLSLYIQLKNYQTILNLQHSQQMITRFIQISFKIVSRKRKFNKIILFIIQTSSAKRYKQNNMIVKECYSIKLLHYQLLSLNYLQVEKKIKYHLLMYQIIKYLLYSQKCTNLGKLQLYFRYKNHIAQYQIQPSQDYYYSPIYLSARNFMPYFALTYSLIINQTLFGITTQLQEVSDKNIQNIPLSIFLVNSNGDIILSTLPTISQINLLITITNQTYTGFNKTDWELIQVNSKQKTSQESSFYLENKLYNRIVFVNAVSFEKENLTLIVFKNVTYEIESGQKIQDQVDNMKIEMIKDLQIYLGISIFLVILTTTLIRYISAPLLNLIKVINIHIRKIGNNLNSELFKMSFKSQKQTDVFSSLTYQFLGLKELQSKRSERKNQICQQIEDIKYSFQYQEIDCSSIKESILLLPSQDLEDFRQNNSLLKPLLLRSFSQKKMWVSTEDQTLYRQILIKQIFQQLFQKNSSLKNF